MDASSSFGISFPFNNYNIITHPSIMSSSAASLCLSRSPRQHQPTSPPPSIASPSTTPALALAHNTIAHHVPPSQPLQQQPQHQQHQSQQPSPSAGPSNVPPPPNPPLQQTLPSPETQRHIQQARAAVVATMENMMDSELHWRASTLHANAAALGKQAKDVRRATDGLRRETDRLAREADVATRRIKELGNVQNWAEVLERDFLVLEETVRLANGGRSRSCSCSDCGSSGSGSVSGSDDEDGGGGGGGDRMDVDVDVVAGNKMEHETPKGVAMEMDAKPVPGTWSEASRSLTDPESSTGRGAKGSDTASTMS